MDPKVHWETIYKAKDPTRVSWFQPDPALSLRLIVEIAPQRDAVIVDVGGGASTLVDGLIRLGYERVTVLDIASEALDAARSRFGGAADRINWVAADVLTHPFPLHGLDVWHDRAVFHFLTSLEDRRAYVDQVRRAVRPNGHVIVATFASDGPTRCSGLDVCRYGAEELHAEFGEGFELLEQVREEHITPTGAPQMFQYCLCAHRPARMSPKTGFPGTSVVLI